MPQRPRQGGRDTPGRPKRRVESYRIYKRPYSACSQSSSPSPSSYEKATHGKLVGPTLSTPRGDKYYNQYRPLCEVCPRDRGKVVGTLQGGGTLNTNTINAIKLVEKCLVLTSAHRYYMEVKLWPQTAPDLQRLHRNDRAMIRWIFCV